MYFLMWNHFILRVSHAHTHTQTNNTGCFYCPAAIKDCQQTSSNKIQMKFFLHHSFCFLFVCWLPFTVLGFFLELVMVIWFISVVTFLMVIYYFKNFKQFEGAFQKPFDENVSRLCIQKMMSAVLSLQTFDTGRRFRKFASLEHFCRTILSIRLWIRLACFSLMKWMRTIDSSLMSKTFWGLSTINLYILIWNLLHSELKFEILMTFYLCLVNAY